MKQLPTSIIIPNRKKLYIIILILYKLTAFEKINDIRLKYSNIIKINSL